MFAFIGFPLGFAMRWRLLSRRHSEAENAGGDKVFGVATRKFNPLMPEQSEGSFQIVHGTGKFAGISGEGRSKLVDVITKTPGEMSGCAHSWGTFTIK